MFFYLSNTFIWNKNRIESLLAIYLLNYANANAKLSHGITVEQVQPQMKVVKVLHFWSQSLTTEHGPFLGKKTPHHSASCPVLQPRKQTSCLTEEQDVLFVLNVNKYLTK